MASNARLSLIPATTTFSMQFAFSARLCRGSPEKSVPRACHQCQCPVHRSLSSLEVIRNTIRPSPPASISGRHDLLVVLALGEPAHRRRRDHSDELNAIALDATKAEEELE
jgi:hypothetical protein